MAYLFQENQGTEPTAGCRCRQGNVQVQTAVQWLHRNCTQQSTWDVQAELIDVPMQAQYTWDVQVPHTHTQQEAQTQQWYKAALLSMAGTDRGDVPSRMEPGMKPGMEPW
jgi:hypothetical protein